MERTSGLVRSEKIGKVKLRRESKPKSRNGCSTCKTRRVKCDESKPICNRCIAFGMKEDCVYIQKGESNPPLKPLAPRDVTLQRAKVPIMKIWTLNTALPGNDAERRYFKFFKDALALDFCGWFETPFWTHFMPQQCHYEPTIRHAILALSAIYSFRASRIAGTSESDSHLKFALVQQNKAIASLKKHMALENPQTRLILIACLLFACVESFHDDLNTTARQFTSGLAILKYWKKEENRKREEDLAVFDDDVRNAIARFELQIKSYLILNPLSGDVSLDYEDEEPPKLPNRFVETGQAFIHASRLSNDFLRYLRKSPRYVKGEIDVALCQLEHRKMKEQIDEWKTRYLELFQTVQTNQNIDPRTHLASIHLITCLRTFEIMFSTCLTKNETIFDDFTQYFTKIVSWCRFSVEKDREMRRSAGLGDSLRAQFGMGTIMPLYYTATRCRDLSVRKDAIAILKGFPSKNGMWDSLMTARVAEWVVEREEKEKVDGAIPEEGRVRASTLKMELRKGAIYVECFQGQNFVTETIVWEQ